MAPAENWQPGPADAPVGAVPPPPRGSEAEPNAQAATAGGELSAGAATSPPPAALTAAIAAPAEHHRGQQDRRSGAEVAGDAPPPSSAPAERSGKARGLDGDTKRGPAGARPPLLTESEAWERVAREVSSKRERASSSCPRTLALVCTIIHAAVLVPWIVGLHRFRAKEFFIWCVYSAL